MSLTSIESMALLPVPEHLTKLPTPLHIYYEYFVEEDAKSLKNGLFSALPGCELYYSCKTTALLLLSQTLALAREELK